MMKPRILITLMPLSLLVACTVLTAPRSTTPPQPQQRVTPPSLQSQPPQPGQPQREQSSAEVQSGTAQQPPAAGEKTVNREAMGDRATNGIRGPKVRWLPLGAGAVTEQERISGLDEQLDEELKQFDGLMMHERRALKEDERQLGGYPTDADLGYRYGDEGEDAGDGAAETGAYSSPGQVGDRTGAVAGDASGGGHRPPPDADRQGDYDATATAPVPPTLRAGSDDDIVARQLRQAAMRETDPALREKLWDEYRKYKQGL